MDRNFSSSFLFLLLLGFQEMVMQGEATYCHSKSSLFKDCNCGTLCRIEEFLEGECRWLSCICTKICNAEGGGGGIFGQPPVQGPPDGGGPPEGYSPGQAPAGAPNRDGPSESASPPTPSGDGIFRWRWTFNY
ncbi:defensin P322 [Olea europaea subsp. europaea]|uniref:Defensin P322 n=1 Tax=Olea europaea subsp. europaea TaxID=158383 RepID=A0A8S0RM01_OLEEU|nr:defensin P322 [Olea europaea subsp. europaea]